MRLCGNLRPQKLNFDVSPRIYVALRYKTVCNLLIVKLPSFFVYGYKKHQLSSEYTCNMKVFVSFINTLFYSNPASIWLVALYLFFSYILKYVVHSERLYSVASRQRPKELIPKILHHVYSNDLTTQTKPSSHISITYKSVSSLTQK